MKKILLTCAALILTAGFGTATASTPEEDKAAWDRFYQQRFPNVPEEDYNNGVYTIDKVGRENWEAIEEFPPYEPFIDAGREMWETPFANGKGYRDCFPNGPAIAGNYPHWDKETGMVMTLPLAVNNCLEANGEKPLKYKKGPINNILSYIAFESRGQVVNVEIPGDDPRALEAYEEGKKFYFTRRGQLNFSCAHCHLQTVGMVLRTETLGPAKGHPTHFPVYRSKWGTVGTLHRRFTGCNKQVRAKPFKAQGKEYRNLEYFLTHKSNGLELNGPGARK
ncbi:MAG: sulfur oxidation c-type cytochrome SoxA [Candidatus Sedimenticola endophacoides]|uniref:SoxAX cytochrome complex subunit A n=1 Tax=Candidatus Sedimenticola endophacoides TaxID=2548426 RepID=A0A657PWH0_9GAMM|nr:MAG: sulfur oxidation c-type cytochrome SoxA [Candidatus Sedimenticola endophacoides]OQX37650.1 MAG: sulfur oxidation c-type cytochrome SoxA [Candidatus Sedimenticola endophacoides]OQX39097.1 MAG: sulfur oxidation c-type cytochrome SoxA [Candidatus Sedimenticola endophacoides]OQX42060.1 MAG: sulfur oxidation c-type cytochrome SoxA [Candidatus Sedimenticola endophacoides]OQX45726.1 MAG: sulfur oxidation c-type cytochrome SoxA [Candidatus Sedimenticola endophacoides]